MILLDFPPFLFVLIFSSSPSGQLCLFVLPYQAKTPYLPLDKRSRKRRRLSMAFWLILAWWQVKQLLFHKDKNFLGLLSKHQRPGISSLSLKNIPEQTFKIFTSVSMIIVFDNCISHDSRPLIEAKRSELFVMSGLRKHKIRLTLKMNFDQSLFFVFK